MMKKIFCFLVVLFLNTVCFARSLQEIKAAGVLRVAVDGSTPGFNFFDRGKLAGFEIDLAEEIAKSLDVKVEWIVQPFNTLLVAVNQERFDLIATSFAITPARAQAVDFTTPHYCTGAVIVSKLNGPKTGADLVGKVVVVPVGTVYLDHLKSIPGIKEIRTVPSETLGLQSLLGGKSDAWVTEQFVAIKALQANAKESLQIGDILKIQTNAMVVAKGNLELLKTVNSTLKTLLKNGTYARLSHKYFGKDIRCR